MEGLAVSGDLDAGHIEELFERAHARWERAKHELRDVAPRAGRTAR
jgi:hypothetical protein